MYVYFDREGRLQEIIYEPVRQGDLYKQTIYVHWDNHPTPINTFNAKIRYSNGEYENVELIPSVEQNFKIPYNQDRDLKFFKYETNTPFFQFTPSNTFPYGDKPTEITFYFGVGGTVEDDELVGGSTHTMQMLTFYVENTDLLVGGDNINNSQWSALLEYLTINNVRAYDQTPSETELLGLGVGGVFFNTTTNKIYKVNSDYTTSEIETGEIYTAGDNITITNNEISTTDTLNISELNVGSLKIDKVPDDGYIIKNTSQTEPDIVIDTTYGDIQLNGDRVLANGNEVQPKLVAGSNITIAGNTISATGGNVNSVNSKTGDVVLTASDIKVSNSQTIQANIADLNDRVSNLEAIGRYLSGWDCTTGLPTTEPPELPYTYKTGDYFIISKVGDTNYKPSGTSYNGSASSTPETNAPQVNDYYVYDGTLWSLLSNTQKSTTWGSIGGTLSNQTDLQNALNGKQATISSSNKLSASLVSGLSGVATSGAYSDLSGKPTKLSDFTNDSGFITNAYHDNTKQDKILTGNGITIGSDNKTISVDFSEAQAKLTAGTNITISGNTISASGGSDIVTLSGLSGVLSDSDYAKVQKKDTLIVYDNEVYRYIDVLIYGGHYYIESKTTGERVLSHRIFTINSNKSYSSSVVQENIVQNTYSSTSTLGMSGVAVASAISGKQDTISDLSTIRSGATLGATALQSVPSEYVTQTELEAYHDSSKQNALGFTPENVANKKTTINDSTTEYPTSSAVKSFVNSSIASATANFKGTFDVVEDLQLSYGANPTQIGAKLDQYGFAVAPTPNDYCFAINKADNNVIYQRFKYNGSNWLFEYQLNNSSFTATQWAAINSGATSANIAQVGNNTNAISSIQTTLGGKIDTAGSGLSKSGTTLNHTNSVTAQNTQAVYPVKIDAQGHISAYGSAVTIPTQTSQLTNNSGFITSSYHDSSKQDTLVSGTNIKTINGNSLVGSGNITISGSPLTSTQVEIEENDGPEPVPSGYNITLTAETLDKYQSSDTYIKFDSDTASTSDYDYKIDEYGWIIDKNGDTLGVTIQLTGKTSVAIYNGYGSSGTYPYNIATYNGTNYPCGDYQHITVITFDSDGTLVVRSIED